jgi:AraC-like DNA-binding protein
LRVFKKEYSLPIHAYILNQKVHKAKELLSQNIPIVDVAIESGFFDQSHLTKSFKQVFQVTPKQYQDGISY